MESLYRAVKRRDWAECRKLVNQGIYTDYADGYGENAFTLAVDEGRTQLVQLIMENDPDVLSKNAPFVKSQIQGIILGYARNQRIMLELLLTGHQQASDLMGCYHLVHNQPRLATDYYYDRRTPIAPYHILVVCFLKTMARNFKHINSRVFMLLYVRGDLEPEECVYIVSSLLAQQDIEYEFIQEVTRAILVSIPISYETKFDLLQVLVLALNRIDAEMLDDRGHAYNLNRAVADVTVDLLLQLQGAGSEDLVLRLATLIDGLQYKDDLLLDALNDGSEWNVTHLLNVVEFFIDNCNCDPNYKDGDGRYVLSWLLHLLNLVHNSDLRPVVRFLLDRGAHPCVRDVDGYERPVFEQLYLVGMPEFGVQTLQCICASKIQEEKIEYSRRLPRNLHKFVELH